MTTPPAAQPETDLPWQGLSITDAIELGEILQFLSIWIGAYPDARASFRRYMGPGFPDYNAGDLQDDLDRFIHRLGAHDTPYWHTGHPDDDQARPGRQPAGHDGQAGAESQ